MSSEMSRREALRRISATLGGVVSASALTAAMSPAVARAWSNVESWSAETLSSGQLEIVATIAEHIIPATDTPGARAAGVHRYVDALLSRYYPATYRDAFIAGLSQTDQLAQTRFGAPFLRAPADKQVALLRELDTQAYLAREAAGRDASLADAALFFRRLKEHTLTGYYTSEIGATKELRQNPMGTFKDVPYSSVGHTWA